MLQRMTTSGTTSHNEWQRVATNDYDWQQGTKSGTANKNGSVYFKEWMIAILSITNIVHYFKGSMAGIRVVK